jgi:hypothetical protein
MPHKLSYIVAIFNHNHFESPNISIPLLLLKIIRANVYWVIQNDCGQVWQLCRKIYVATVWMR